MYGVYHKCGLLPFRIHVQLIFLWPDDDSPMQRVCLAEGSRYHKLWTGLRLFLFIGSQLALFIGSQFAPMNTLWCHQTWQAGKLRTKWRFIFWEDSGKTLLCFRRVPGSIHVFVPMDKLGNGSKSIDEMKTVRTGTVSLMNQFMYPPVC